MQAESVHAQFGEIEAHDDKHGALPTRMTVKEVARRLRVSTSTVYRINRVDGPFQFISDGRRIFIDSASFELYIRHAGGMGANDGPTGAECANPDKNPISELEAQPLTVRMQPEPQVIIVPSPFPHPSKGGGQRDLIMRESNGPCFFSYPSFL